ncbi:MAG: ParB/RepB/Spo0J family partition protein, partial [Acidobacteriota bacterium]
FVEQLAVRHTDGIGENIPIDSLIPNPHQPRRLFDAIDELVASIKEVGVLEPLLVRRTPQGHEIVSGERRYRAAVDAGLEHVPCIVLDVDEAQVLTIALIENLQRQDLSPFEEAEGLKALVERFNLTHEEVARKIGKSRTSVTEVLSLSDIPEMLRERLHEAGVSTKSILLEVARTEDPEEQAALVDRIVEEGLTRDQLRAMRRGETAEEGAPQPEEPPAREPQGRRITYRSGTGITLTLYLNRPEITVPDIQQTLREAIAELDDPSGS